MNALLLALTCLTAAPQPTDAPSLDAQAPTASARADGTRGRFGIGAYGGGGSNLPGVGLSIQLGVQLNDQWAVYVLAQGQTILVAGFGSASLIVERTFADLLSVGTGVGTMAANHICINYSGQDACPDFSQVGVQVPLRIALNFGPETTSSIRHRFFVAADGGLGVMKGSDPSRSGVAWNAGLSLGYVMM